MSFQLKIDLRQLNTFLTIAEVGSFSRASEKLFVAQPALSRQIRLMEEALNAEVFVRHGRGEKSGNTVAKPSKNFLIKLLPSLVTLAKTIHQSTSTCTNCP